MIYDYTITTGKGETLNLADYKGKVIMVVNTATGCGFTPHYEPLEAMYKDLKDQGFEILDFPCNQFANQAPGDAEEIHQFCTLKFGADFPQFAKIDVNGENAEPLYAWLATEKPFAGFGKGLKNAALNKFADMNNKAFGDKTESPVFVFILGLISFAFSLSPVISYAFPIWKQRDAPLPVKSGFSFSMLCLYTGKPYSITALQFSGGHLTKVNNAPSQITPMIAANNP